MNEFDDVLITIQMRNDSEIAETCFTVTMTDTNAYALLNEIRGESTILAMPFTKPSTILPRPMPPSWAIT